MLFGMVEASTLGWTQQITTIATEVRNVAGILVIIGVALFGAEIAITRHFDRLGGGLAAFSIGGALIAGAAATAAAIAGGAAGASLTPAVVVLARSEGVSDMLAALFPFLTPGILGAWAWLRVRHGD